MLAKRGAVIIDADAIVHELQSPGSEVLDEIADALGKEVIREDGSLDRPKVASIVFADPEKRQKLQGIMWPRVGTRVAELIEGASDDDIVILDVPLMAESREGSRRNAQKVIVVDASKESQLRHLDDKGVSRQDAEARMAAQATRQERLELADFVVNNDGSIEDLEAQVEELWKNLLKEIRS
jgi:dephospho-CoA kinase